VRFLFVLKDLGPHGVANTRLRYSRELARRGHDVTILALIKGETQPMPDGVRFEILDAATTHSLRTVFQQVRFAFRLRRWFKRETRTCPFDFVSSSMTPTDRVVAHSGLVNVYHWIHIATTELIGAVTNKRKRERRTRLLRAVYRGKPVIGVSHGVIADLLKLDAAPCRSTLIYNGFDLERIRAMANEHPPDLPRERFYIHVGRFAGAKRHDVLFEALGRSGSGRKLLLLTDKPQEASKLAQELNVADRVIALGFRDNPYAYMQAADGLILCSDLEGFPNVLVESLIVGTPVISTDCPYGPAEILTGPYSEWLSPVGDCDALASQIRKLETMPYAIDPWLYERFSLSSSVDALERLAKSGDRPYLGRFRLRLKPCEASL
jgi:glycosyltransferase involved in cell wall biosynthesis